MASSNQTSKVDQIRALARQEGMDSAYVESRLVEMGLVEPPAGAGGFGRTLGLAARGPIQGIGNLVGLPFGMAGLAYHGLTGNTPPAMLQPQGANAATALGLPQPATPGERMAVSAGEGATMGAMFPGAGPASIALGGGAGLASQGAAEAGAGPLGQMAASFAVGAGIPITGAVLSGAIRAAIAGSAARREAAEQAKALIQAGDPNAAVTLGQVAGGGPGRGGIGPSVEAGAKNLPGAQTVYQRTIEKQAEQMGQRAEAIATRVGRPMEPAVIGQKIKAGFESGFLPKFRATQDRLEQAVSSYIPNSTGVQLPHTANLISAHNSLSAAARELSDDIASPAYAGILGRIDQAVANSPNGTVPWGVLREIRARLGAHLSGENLLEGVDHRDVARLWGSLTDDMTIAVYQHSGKPGIDAWGKALTHWRTGQDRIQHVLNPLVKHNTPEKVFEALVSGSREGATVARSTMRSLSAGEQEVVQANIIRRMGRAPAGAQGADGDVFSPKVFLTAFNKFTPEARDALFGPSSGLGRGLYKLAQASELIARNNQRMANTSGSAPNVAFGAVLAGLGTAVAGAATGNPALIKTGLAPAAALGASNLAMRAFTSPRIVDWLIRQTEVPFGALNRELALLVKDSQKWAEEDRETAIGLASHLGNLDWRTILMAQAVTDATATRPPQ